jgi:uncharacterized protein (TIGR02217 family)
MAHIETLFPVGISYNATGGPTFATDIAEVDSGYEYANQNWSSARMRFEVGHDARTATEFQTLLAFYLAVKGRANSFNFKDWSDFTVTSAQGIFATIDSTHFQMYRRYTTGGTNYDRKIMKPVSGTVSVTGGTVSSISYTTGIVTMTSGTPTAWAGQFYVPVRFDTDMMQASMITRSGGTLIHGWPSIVLLEVRL